MLWPTWSDLKSISRSLGESISDVGVNAPDCMRLLSWRETGMGNGFPTILS